MGIYGGATLWARKTIKSDLFVWRSHVWFKIWFFIINEVNYKDKKHFERGSGFMTYDDIRRGTGATQSQVDGFVRYAKRTTMLTTHKTTRGMIVKVLNYHKYQSLENYKNDAENDSPDELKTKRKRNGNDTINKNDKNDKNDNTIDFEKFWNLYDKKIGKPKSEAKWNKLSLEEKEKILEYIPRYKVAQPEKKYRKNPETFFNNRSWEDEIIGEKIVIPIIPKPKEPEVQISEEDRKRNIAKMAEVRNQLKNKLKA
jgi:hypothetical protein